MSTTDELLERAERAEAALADSEAHYRSLVVIQKATLKQLDEARAEVERVRGMLRDAENQASILLQDRVQLAEARGLLAMWLEKEEGGHYCHDACACWAPDKTRAFLARTEGEP